MLQVKCYGSTGKRFASFQAPNAGKVKSIKLTHVNGGVSCNTLNNNPPSRWGCNNPWNVLYKPNLFKTVVTESLTNQVIFPSTHDKNFMHIVDGGDLFTTKAVILTSAVPYPVKAGDELQIWYSEDLLEHLDLKYWTHDNDPNILHCVKISLKYC